MIDGDLDGEYFRNKPYIKSMHAHAAPIPMLVMSGGIIIASLKSSRFTPKGLQDVGDKKIAVPTDAKWGQMMAKRVKNVRSCKKFVSAAK